MRAARNWRVVLALPAALLLLGLKCPLTSETAYGTIVVENQSPGALATVKLTHSKGSTTASNVAPGATITFSHIPEGSVSVVGSDSQGNPITAGTGISVKDQSSTIVLY